MEKIEDVQNLTSQQANELVTNFLALDQAIGDYRYQNFDTLTKSQNLMIRYLNWSILNYTDDLYTLSATLFINDIRSSKIKQLINL